MARKVTDTYPVFTISVGAVARRFEHKPMTRDEAEQARAEFAEMLDDLKAQTRRQFGVESRLDEDARCEHCNSPWTEADPDYNGGCCGLDEANSPERLKEFRTFAEEVLGEVYYRHEDGKRERISVSWPEALAHGIIAWLDRGRTSDGVEWMLGLAKRVKSSGWCTVWEDPGPAGCSLPRQPDRVSVTTAPEDLADDLCSLLDDMGLLPATRAA